MIKMYHYWMLLNVFLTAVSSFEITDERYYEMPRLFHLDDYEECLRSRRGVYCLGSFDLLPYDNSRLLDTIQRFSEDKYHFNHTHIHRGYCLTTRCAHIPAATLRSRFEKCVDNFTRAQYGLETNLTTLEYCKTGAKPRTRQFDRLDIAFGYLVGVILFCNLIGTAYDALRSSDQKPNRFLVCWSLIVNWNRLTADYSDGDPRLSALKPVQGMKVITLMLIMLAHSVLAHHITYILNPQFLEKSSHHVMSAYFQNGTNIVHTFIMVSSFLLAYNLLLHADGNPKKQLSFMMLPKCILHRIVRISPVYLFVLGMTTTWWSHSGDGPMWSPLVEGESIRCREKWWMQALYINNFVKPDVKCLIHTWFLAVDMQIYIVSAVLTLALGRRLYVALRILALLIVGSVLFNLVIISFLQLKPMVVLMFPEFMRLQFHGEASFNWLYAAPWDGLPSALIGLFVAFLHYTLQINGYQPNQSMTLRVLYRMTVPLMFLWVLGGYWMKGATNPLWVSLYAAIDRPTFISLTAFAMFGFFNKIDNLWWKFLSWRGWEILGRMSLSIYLIHWLYSLSLLAMRPYLSPVSVNEIGGHWLSVIFYTYVTAVPVHLCVELPLQKFLQTLIS